MWRSRQALGCKRRRSGARATTLLSAKAAGYEHLNHLKSLKRKQASITSEARRQGGRYAGGDGLEGAVHRNRWHDCLHSTPDGYEPFHGVLVSLLKANPLLCCRSTDISSSTELLSTHPSALPPSQIVEEELVDILAPADVAPHRCWPTLLTPSVNTAGDRVAYQLVELDILRDSPAVRPSDWMIMAQLIRDNWGKFDGFVVLHGTDTLAYTSSIMSFLFAGAGKPIVLTGSQIPLSQPRSDGWSNIHEALIVAGTLPFCGVGLLFAHRLMCGARVTKVSSSSLAAFESPLLPAMLEFNVDIEPSSLVRARHANPLPPVVHLGSDQSIVSIQLYPGLQGRTLQAQIDSLEGDCQAVILSAFGSGNIPTADEVGLLDVLRKAVAKGLLVIVLSQCHRPLIVPLYPLGRALLAIGVVPGMDMCHEAAFSKALWLLSQPDLTLQQRKDLFMMPIASEIMENPKLPDIAMEKIEGKGIVGSPSTVFVGLH